MITFVWILLLSLLWVAMTEQFSLANLATGFVLGYFVIFITQRIAGGGGFLVRFPRFLVLVGYFIWELIVANARVAYDVLTPTYYMRPGIVALPLDARTDVEITFLANLISLTPGTLSLDLSSDRTVLYVYTMFIRDRDEFIRTIKDGLERRLLEALR
jgi:multicomponent Na+:H+ antiporter subunit E